MKNDVFKTRCPNCLAEYELKLSFKGRRARCQKCRQSFVLNDLNENSADDGALRLNDDAPNAGTTSASRSTVASEPSKEGAAFAPEIDANLFAASFDAAKIGSATENVEENAPSDGTASVDETDSERAEFPPEFANETFPDPPPGVWRVGEKLLDDSYLVLPIAPGKLYAEGGVGLVQRVRRREWNLDFVVKSPKPDVVVSEEGKASFERECQTWIGLGLHQNIVSCYFVRRIGGVPRLFAEFAPDGTLRDWIADGRLYVGTKKEALARILDAAIQFAWGLEHAHRQGVLHLDVKPSNVMTSGTTIKVTDFGLAKAAAGGDVATDSCDGMTPSYCSPEQYEAFQLFRKNRARKRGGGEENGAANGSENAAKSIPMTRQSDIWSWAISILAMFHGRSPCKMGGQTAAEVFEIFLQTPPSDKRPAMPPGLVELLRRCFRKDPAERPESMQAVADRLVEIYAEEIGEKYPRRQPKNAASTAESFSNRAVSLIDLGKTDEALDLLWRASALEPFHPQIAFNRTLALWRTGQIRDLEAVARLAELTKNRPRDATAHYALGLVQLERLNLKAAIETFRTALSLDGKREDVRQAIERAESRLSRDAICLERRVLRSDGRRGVPPLFVDENGECLLVELDGDRRVVLGVKGAKDGELQTIFFKNDANGADFEPPFPKTIAVSEDYRWKMTATGPNSAVVSPAARQGVEGLTLRFREVDWGTLRAREARVELDGAVQKSDGGATSAPSAGTRLLFVPNANNGVDLVEPEANVKLANLPSNGETLTALAVSADGRWAATGGDDAKIAIWDVARGRCVRTFGGLAGSVEALWFDAKARYVVSLSKGAAFQYWRVDGLCRRSSKTTVAPLLCFVNTSEELDERQTRFDELISGARAADEAGDAAKIVELYKEARKIDGWEAIRPEFETVLDARAHRADVDDAIQTFNVCGHDGPISALAAAWNGSFVVSAGKDGAIRLWGRAATGGKNGISDENGAPSANGSADFAAQNRADAGNDWRILRELPGHSDWIRAIAISPNNRFLVSGGWDQRVYFWDLATGRRLRGLSEPIKNVSKIAFAPDGRTVAVATEFGEASLWDGATGEPLFRRSVGSGAVQALRFSRDGRYFATACEDGAVRFWSGRGAIPEREIVDFPAPISALDLTCGARLLAAGCENGKIYLVDLTDSNGKTRRELAGHLGGVRAVSFFLDVDWLASTGKDRTARIWRTFDGSEAKKIEVDSGEISATALDFIGGTLFVGCNSGYLKRWKLHWEYDFPGRIRSREEIARTVSALAAYYAIGAAQVERKTPPSAYYGADARGIQRFSNAFPLTESVLKRVCAEADRRGLGAVPRETIREVATALWRVDAPTFSF